MWRKQLHTLDHPPLLVIVEPILTRLEAGNDRIPCCRRMLGRMLARRTVAATDHTSHTDGEELGIGFVPWGPVGQGYLTRKIDAGTKFDPKMDMRSGFPRFSPENIAANMPIVDLIRQFAEKKNATPAQISLAWLLAQKPFVVPIPGTRNIDHLNESGCN